MNDNFPQGFVLPTSQEFREATKELVELMFQALEQQDFEQFDRLKSVANCLERAAKVTELT